MDALHGLIDPQDWQLHAACRGRQDLFFAPDDESETRVERRRREARAKTICASCVVRLECLDEAMEQRERFGIWGGMTERERRALVARRTFASPTGQVPPRDIAGPGRPQRLPAVVAQGRAMSPEED
ncbi:MAG TPA: WhiB family transcriptional regulator [Actinomycetota bacterium]|nr:WhiB family transcriptional regulator [Actinomycetota bacterium]